MSQNLLNLPTYKCGMSIEHNEHKSFYETAADYIDNLDRRDDFPSEAEIQKAIETDSIWTLRWYPDTPIGSCVVRAATLEECLRFANESA